MSKKEYCYHCMSEIKEENEVCPVCGYVRGTPPDEPFQLVPGTILKNKYLVGTALGFSGSSVTYIGLDLALRTKIIIKEYYPSEFVTRIPGQNHVTVTQSEDRRIYEENRERFTREAQRLASLDHIDSVVKVYNAFAENGTAYIIREYLVGETIQDMIRRRGRIPPEEVFQMMLPLMTSLEIIHRKGILHREITPENIIYTRSKQAKLMDFSASRIMPHEKSSSLSVFIKPGFTPPEQYSQHGNHGTWTDVYSLAASIYNMLTGEIPPDVMTRGKNQKLLPPTKKGVKLSKSAETAIMNALVLDPDKRTRTVEEFYQQLISAKEVTRVIDSAKSEDNGRFPLWMKITGAGLLCVFLIFGVLLFSGVFRSTPPDLSGYSAQDGKTVVPTLRNQTVKEAEQRAESHQIVMKIYDKVDTADIPQDIVYDQKTEAGTLVDINTAVYVRVSGGIKSVLIEGEFLGIPYEDAKKLLEQQGFKVTMTETESAYEKGIVCGCSIEPDENGNYIMEKGGSITLQVSKGQTVDRTRKEKVPGFVGKTLSKAQELAEKSGFTISVTYEYSETVEKDTVIRQSIPENTEKPKGTKIVLTVSKGSEEDKTVLVPYLEYMDVNEAKAELESAGLKCRIEYEESDTVANNHVIRQSIKKDTIVSKGTTVVLTVSIERTADVSSRQESSRQESSRQESSKQESSRQESSKQESSRQESSTPAVTLQSISVTRMPDKTQYYLGESFNSTGLRVTASYSDHSSKVLTSSQYSLSGFDSSSVGTKTITVSYSGKKASFTVKVVKKPAVLQEIVITRQPNKTQYYVGDSFDPTGLQVSAKYSDNSTKALSSSEYSISGFSSSSVGTKTITVSYSGKTASFTVSVINDPSIVESGQCGANVTYTLKKDGLLTIKGTGPTYDYNSCPFAHADQILKVSVQSGVTALGSHLFDQCVKMTSVKAADSVVSIGENTFYNCKKLNSADLPDSITEIGSYAFWGCSGLTSLNLPGRLSTIRSHAFEWCSELTSVQIPSGVTILEEGAFCFCYKLTKAVLPEGLTTIGESCFSSCESLVKLSLPESVTTISDYAFRNCYSLADFWIPKNVTFIGKEAFRFWKDTQTIHIQGKSEAPNSWDSSWNSRCGANILWNE